MTTEKRKFKILVVDDSTAIIKKIGLILQENGYQVKTTHNPVLAYRMIENDHYDIVISDIEMPEMTGLELIEKIKQFSGMTQVIIMTGFATVSNVLRAFRFGAADLIYKPLDEARLLKIVRKSTDRLEYIEGLLEEAVNMKR